MLDGRWYVFTRYGKYLGLFETRLNNGVLTLNRQIASQIKIGDVLHLDGTRTKHAWSVTICENYKKHPTVFVIKRNKDRKAQYPKQNRQSQRASIGDLIKKLFEPIKKTNTTTAPYTTWNLFTKTGIYLGFGITYKDVLNVMTLSAYAQKVVRANTIVHADQDDGPELMEIRILSTSTDDIRFEKTSTKRTKRHRELKNN